MHLQRYTKNPENNPWFTWTVTPLQVKTKQINGRLIYLYAYMSVLVIIIWKTIKTNPRVHWDMSAWGFTHLLKRPNNMNKSDGSSEKGGKDVRIRIYATWLNIWSEHQLHNWACRVNESRWGFSVMSISICFSVVAKSATILSFCV